MGTLKQEVTDTEYHWTEQKQQYYKWRNAEYHLDRTTMNRWQAPKFSSEKEGTKTESEETGTEESFHDLEPEPEEPTVEALALSSWSQKQELPKSPAQILKVETLKTGPQELDDMAAKETRINLPKEFTRDRNDVSSFLQDVELYFIMNSHIYDTDDKKIIFILLFLTNGAAWTWK